MPPKTPKKRTRLDHLEQAKVDHGLAADGTEYSPDDLDDLILTKRIAKAAKRTAANIRRAEQCGDAWEPSDQGPVAFMSKWEIFVDRLNTEYRRELAEWA